MNSEEYREHLTLCWIMVGALRTIRLKELDDAITAAESSAPILDPTLYRAKGQAMAEDARVIRALRRLQRELQPYVEGVIA